MPNISQCSQASAVDNMAAIRGYKAKVFMANLRRERIAAGVCTRCGGGPLVTLRQCQRCAELQNKADREVRDRRRQQGLLVKPSAQAWDAQGLCRRCGGPRDTGRVVCSACRAASRLYGVTGRVILTAKRVAAGLCVVCSEIAVPGARYCAIHAAAHREQGVKGSRALRARRRAAGQCLHCNAPSLPAVPYCAFHHVRRLVAVYTKDPAPGLVDEIVAKYTGFCAYTGWEIPLGGTGHLEHIYPKKHYPELVVEPTNLTWVHAVMNEAKSDLSPDSPLIDKLFLPSISARIRACAAGVRKAVPVDTTTGPTDGTACSG